MIKTAIVTLEIEYDDLESSSPKRWNWNELLDIGGDEKVTLINFREKANDYISN
jgi:hypothetical protein